MMETLLQQTDTLFQEAGVKTAEQRGDHDG